MNTHVDVLIAFQKMVQETNPSTAEFVDMCDRVKAFGHVVGPSYMKHRLYLEGLTFLMRDKPLGVCQLCDKTSACMVALASEGLGEHDLTSIAGGGWRW